MPLMPSFEDIFFPSFFHKDPDDDQEDWDDLEDEDDDPLEEEEDWDDD